MMAGWCLLAFRRPVVLVAPHPILDEILRDDPDGYALFH